MFISDIILALMYPTYYTHKIITIDLYNNILKVEGLSKFCGHMCWTTRAIWARFESQQTRPTCKSRICLFLFNTANLWTMDQHYFYMIYELKAIFWTWLYGPIAEGACLVLTMVLHREFEIVGGTISILSFALSGFSNYQSAVVMLDGRRKFAEKFWS